MSALRWCRVEDRITTLEVSIEHTAAVVLACPDRWLWQDWPDQNFGWLGVFRALDESPLCYFVPREIRGEVLVMAHRHARTVCL